VCACVRVCMCVWVCVLVHTTDSSDCIFFTRLFFIVPPNPLIYLTGPVHSTNLNSD